MARSFPNNELRNVHMRFTESGNHGDEEITFLYEVGEGVAHRSYGLNVARLANLPSSILDVAKRRSNELEERIRRKRFAAVVKSVETVLREDSASTSNVRAEDSLVDKLVGVAEQL